MFVAIIQARMGSTRLPGKVMKKILDKPLIEYLLQRVSTSKYIDKIIVATTSNTEDDTLSQYVLDLGYDVFRGSVDDVLGRYYDAYLTLGKMKDSVQGIIRITGDCPLFEADICDKLIEGYRENDLDFMNIDKTFAEGLDCSIFSKELLVEAFNNAKLQSEREHVTLYFHNHKDKFHMDTLINSEDDSKYRITVDEDNDLEVVKNIIEYCTDNQIKPNIQNIKQYLDENQEVFFLNSTITRNEGLLKSLKDESIRRNG
jgi:spore coat polysaccharide biosynthesis protein SpsF